MIDPMSGNMVPPGALPNEVADDVPINASEGEYVLSADVVRYLGLDKIQKLEEQAKKGIDEMGQEGRIGGEPPMPEMPPEMPQEPMMYNQGGLISRLGGVGPQTTGTDTSDLNMRGADFAFSPAPYTGGFDANAGTQIKKYVGPDGRILYIPINAAGNPVIAVPEGFTDAGEQPTTPEAVQRQLPQRQQDPGRGAMWSDGLTPDQIREEQANRTFRTADQLNPRGQGTGQLPGFLGDALSGIGDRIKGAMDKLTSGEALGAIAQLATTVLLGPLAGPIAGKVMGEAIDTYNEKRRAEGLPEQAVEDVLAEAAPNVTLSTSQVQEVANNSTLSPSRYRTVNREDLGFPPTPDNVQREATQEAGLDLEKYTVLGVSGTAEDPNFMIRGPDGKIHASIKPGDEIDGVVFEGLKEGVDPFMITRQALSQVANLGGTLDERPSMMDPFARSEEALGRGQIGFQQSPMQTPSIGASRPSTGGGTGMASPSRGLSPTSQGVSFGGGGGSDYSAAERATMSGGSMTSGVGRTGTGSGSVSQAFSGSSSPSASPRSTSSVGRSMGTTVSGHSDRQMGTGLSMGETVSRSPQTSGGHTANYNRGGLVDSPYKSYDITKGYKKGGLVTRNKKG